MSDQELMERFVEVGARVLLAERSLTPEVMDRPGADGGWSPRYVVHHLADAELVNARRLRRLLSEDDAHLGTFDQIALAERTHYERAIEPSIALFDAIQAANVELIGSLSPEDWIRESTHAELGRYTISVWLTRRIDHNIGHLNQLVLGT